MDKFSHKAMSPELIHQLGHDERTPAHTHDLGHLVYPATGVLSLVTRDGSWIAPSNRVVWVPSGFEHQHRAHGATDMRIVFLPDGMAEPLGPYPAVLATTPLARESLLALTGSRQRSRESTDRLRLVAIDELSLTGEQPLYLPEPHDDRLLAVTQLVEEDLSNVATLAQLGRQVGASERTLSRLFQQETGMTFRQWRAELRVHRALLLLAEGRSVYDTAAECGWANPNSFITAFTSLVGMSPGRYQHSMTSM
ncbi:MULTISPECIES: helix-turn-helix domain-containing protein [unclassified Brevibacterium]|uniref:helix-turn-helix domain-containing protein n=1 Tax=unclassified Brevibacterium TaxID=2614124 RepID=UPI000C673040|nr:MULTISPECIES: helix-turn-helix transcriptional regulator [unclassified Brevibacterium]SMX90715.1 AraC-type DNA-binding protein [Brevibacterium sp. 239c]